MEKQIALKGPFTKRSLLFASLALGAQLIVYLVPTIFTPVLNLHNITLPIDTLIPFWPAFIIPYVLVFIEWGYCYLLAPLVDRARFGRYAAALALGFLVTFLIFFAFPTTYARPTIEGGGFFAKWVGFIFGIDQPSRCLPSLHCLLGWLNWRLVAKEARVPKWMRAAALCLALITLPTTLFVKQHVIVDVPAGVLLAELVWFLAERTKLSERFLVWFERLAAKLGV